MPKGKWLEGEVKITLAVAYDNASRPGVGVPDPLPVGHFERGGQDFVLRHAHPYAYQAKLPLSTLLGRQSKLAIKVSRRGLAAAGGGRKGLGPSPFRAVIPARALTATDKAPAGKPMTASRR